jgi:PAS domain S-box-containing protein
LPGCRRRRWRALLADDAISRRCPRKRARGSPSLKNLPAAPTEEQMRSVIDHVVDGIITIDERGTITTFNPAAERIFEYPSAEVIGRNIAMLMPEPDRSQHDGYIANYVRTGERKIIGIGREVVGRRKSGATFPMELAINEFHLNEERYFTGIVRDITERKQAEEKLRRAEERMRSVVNHVVDGIITIDERGRIESFNPAAEKLFGFSREEVLGANVKMLMPEPYHSEHDAYLSNYARTRIPKIIGIGREVLGRRKDGSTFPMELAVSEFAMGERRYFTGIVRDITERKRLEDRLRTQLGDLAETDRQKTEFLAMLGHELRNPLGPMRSALFLMKHAHSEAQTLDHAREVIERQLQQLVRLVDDLLDISRIVRSKIDLRLERMDLGQAIRRGIETAQPVIDANGHVLEVSLPPEPAYVQGDLIRLAQAVANLLTNAAKYSGRAGRIWIGLERAGGYGVVTVRDEGEGIAPELLPRIFDLFVQGEHGLARSRGGLGIGLTLVRRIVEMHRGVVSAHSEGPDRGSTFTISLPLVQAGDVEAIAPSSGALVQSAVRRRVLVVDDNVDAADSIADVLRLYGHEVRCAYDGPGALEAARSYGPDVVVLDIGLPGMDGYEVATRLRQMSAFSAIPIIAVTGYGQTEDRAQSEAAGFDRHLTKPVDLEELQEVVSGGPG